jgi:uncharacterized protein (DUF1501 family)
MNRRFFLKRSGLALVGLGFVPSFLARTVLAQARHRKVLVAIFQRGAVDGLNMIVPHGEEAYYAARPTIAIGRPGAPDGAIALDGLFGLHPRLAPLQSLWSDGRLSIVHATGSPDSTRSHFDAQDYMESATPGRKSTPDGWLNRCLQAGPPGRETPLRAVALAPQLPRSLQGRAPALAIADLGRFALGAGPTGVAASFEEQYAAAADRALQVTAGEAFDAMRTVGRLDLQHYQPASGASYPPSPFGSALRQIAQLIKADVGLEVAFAELGGWDTHVNQGNANGQLAVRLDDLARGLAALVADLGPKMDDVVILTMSEFGRAVTENGNRGTDHGHGNAMLAIGGGMRGGRIVGRWPGLAPERRFEGRDLAVTTDFRDVFAEIAVRHLGIAHPQPIFPGHAINLSAFVGMFG